MERDNLHSSKKIFEHYMRMDPTKKADRCFMENKCASLANNMFVEAQYLELLRNHIQSGEAKK